jgi:3-oxoacyl-[acyl-carrier-protein] synthase II
MALASGCTSALDVIQWACGQIGSGRTPGALGGGADSPLSSVIQATWAALGSLSRWPGHPSQALRPFDAASSGTVLGEAAGAFVLEDYEHATARGAPIYAEVLGHGSGNLGLQSRTPEPTATAGSLEAALRGALRAANLDVSEIDYISTHGGGVPKQDRGETAAYKAVFGQRAYNIPISSIKPVTGNPFSAGGALQVIAGCLTLAEQFLPPTLNLDAPDSVCDLDYVPNRGRTSRVNRLLITTRGIGPTYSVVILGHPQTLKGRRAS